MKKIAAKLFVYSTVAISLFFSMESKVFITKIKKILLPVKIFKAFLYLFFFIILSYFDLFAVNVANEAELIAAINSANTTPQTIQFTANITLTGPLPAITNTYTIDGNDGTAWTLSGGSAHRGFIILGSVSPTIQDLIIVDTKATGGTGGIPDADQGGSGGGGLGAGGAIYVGNGANVTLSNITYNRDNATGGNAGALSGIASAGGGSGGGGLGGNGGGSLANDGGGGGGILEAQNAIGISGGGVAPYKGADGADSTIPANATTPGYGGGGGGAANIGGTGASSAGGFGGGGGGGSSHATDNINAAAGGFGGGGGGGGKNSGTSILGGFNGGAGAAGTGAVGGQGGGGAGLGGAIFVDDTSTATIKDGIYDFGTGANSNTLTAGTGANSGSTAGTDIFLASGGTLKIDTNGTFTVGKNIEADTLKTTGGLEILDSVGTGGTVNFTGLTNTFGGTFTLTKGTFQFNNNNAFGNATGITFPNNSDSKIFSCASSLISPPITISGPATINSTVNVSLTSAITGNGELKVTLGGRVSSTISSPGFSGGINIDGGFFNALNSTGTVGTGPITIQNGGRFRFETSVNGTFTNNFVFGGTGNIFYIRSTRTCTISGNTSGSGSITFRNYLLPGSATGNLVLTGNNTYSGEVIATDVILMSNTATALSSASAITLDSPVVFQINNVSQEIKDLSGVKTGAEILEISLNHGSSNTLSVNQINDKNFPGILTLTGKFEKKGPAKLTFNSTSPFTFTGGTIITAGTLELNSSADLLATSSSVTINGGSLDITASTAAKTFKNLSGTGGVVNLNNNNLTIDQTSALQYDGVISGTGTLTKQGASTLTLGGANTYSGATSITDGTLALASLGTILSSPSVTATSPGALQISSGAGDKTVNDFSGTGNLILNNTGSKLTLNQSNPLTISGVISGTGNLEKAGGVNTLTLEGINTFSGSTTVTTGTLTLNSAGNLASTSALILNSATNPAFSITVGAGSKTVGSLSGSGNIQLNENTLTVNQGVAATTYNGVISGTGGFTQQGSATAILNLAATQLYTGTTTISAGILNLSTALSDISSSSALTINGGSLDIASGVGAKTVNNLSGTTFGGINLNNNNLTITQSSALQFDGVISGTGILTKQGANILTLAGVNSYSGATSITAGTLALASGGTIANSSSVTPTAPGALQIDAGSKTINNFSGSGSLILNNTGNTLSVNQTSDLTHSGVISGTGNFLKSGGAILTLTGANTFTSSTTISDGTLKLDPTGGIDSSANVTITSPGILNANNGGTSKNIRNLNGSGNISFPIDSSLAIPVTTSTTYSGNILGDASKGIITLTGAGNSLTLSGSNTFKEFIIASGTLNVSSNSNLANLTTLQTGTFRATDTFSTSKNLTISGVGAKTIEVLTGKTVTLLGTITASADVSKTGAGTLSINSANAGNTGTTTVAQGTMLMKPASSWSATNFNISSGANLIGNGTVTAALTNGGRIAPGESIGTLNIVGSYTENGILEIEITSNPNDSDKVVVTGVPGTATLNPTSTLSVLPLSSSEFFQEGTEYVIITATGGVSGTFGNVIDTDPLLLFDVRYEPNQVVLIMSNSLLILPINAITKRNAKAVAEYLESCNFSNPDFRNIVITLSSLNLPNLTDALLQISPEQFGALQLTNYTNNQTISKILTDRLRKLYRCNKLCKQNTHKTCIKPNSYEVWFEPFTYFKHQKNIEKQRPYQNMVFGAAMGSDFNFSNRVNFGGALSYSFSDIDWKNNLGDAHIHSIYGSLYASNYNPFGFLNASITAAGNFYTTKRDIHFADIKRVAKGKHKGFDITPHLGCGLDFLIKNKFSFQPTLDVDYTYVWRDGFKEKGADSLNLIVDTSNFSRVKGVFLLNFIKDYKYKNICLSPAFKFGYSYENELSTGKIRSRLEGVSCTENKFSVHTFGESHSKAVLGFNVVGTKKDGFTVYLNYQFEVGEKFYQHLGSARVEWNF